MSVEAVAWVLNDAPIPRDTPSSQSLTLVLIGLANHAHPDGRHAFPGNEKLAKYARVSVRTVIRRVAELEELGLIRPGDPAIVAAHITRADHRPNIWDLAIERGDIRADGVTSVQERGDIRAGDGVTLVSPEPSLEPSLEPTSLSLPLSNDQQTLDVPVPPSKPHWTGTHTARRIPEDLTISRKMVEFGRTQAPLVDVRRETAQFVDHWRAAAGPTARKKDWMAAWRTWMRKAQQYAEDRSQRQSNGRRVRTDPTDGRKWQE